MFLSNHLFNDIYKIIYGNGIAKMHKTNRPVCINVLFFCSLQKIFVQTIIRKSNK